MTEKELGNLIQAKDPSIVFIAEIWMEITRPKKKTKENGIYNLVTCSLYLGFIEVGDWFCIRRKQ